MPDPIKPRQPSVKAASKQMPQPTVKGSSPKKEPVRTPRQSITQYPATPILNQKKDIRSQSGSTPLSIVFLDGDFAGKSLDLGVSVEEISHEQSSEWADSNAPGIRSGCNFSRISNRTFSLKLTFYDTKYDISHLVENLAHLHEISTGQTTPSTLLWKQGDLRGERVVCTSFRPNYKNPLGGSKGFHFAEVELQFKLLGGKSSPDGRGRPLTGTPLQIYRNTLTITERQKKAATAAIQQLLAPCVGEKGTKDLSDLIINNKQQNEAAILALDYKTFVNGAVGGIFSKNTLNLPAIKEKLRIDLARVIAEKEPGAGIESRKLAEALVSNNASSLTVKLQIIFEQLKSDYDKILSAVAAQDIGDDSRNDVYSSSLTLDRMNNALDCGLSLRKKGRLEDASAGGSNGVKPSELEASLLKEINSLIASNPNADKIKEAFGVSTPAEIKVLTNSAPYVSKEQFYQDSSRATVGLTGYNIWSNFVTYSAKQKEPKPT